MTVRQIHHIQNNQIIINLPDDFKYAKEVIITIDDHLDESSKKMLLMQQAKNDLLFQQDLKEVEDDFKFLDK
jgi:molybdopterin biosynthesis enzyme MoaB